MIRKKVKGWPYHATTCGLIISLQRKIPYKTPGRFVLRQERILKPKINGFGYQCVTLQHRRKIKHVFVHRLIAETFISKRPANHFVNHKNCIKIDNRVENLEWVTRKQNYAHAKENNRIKTCKGEAHGHSKLLEKQVLKIRSSKENLTFLSNKYGVSIALISLIRNKKVWKHI